MKGKHNIPVIFLLCFILKNVWCDTNEQNEEGTIIIGGYFYPASIRTVERFKVDHKAFESLDGIEQLENLKILTILNNSVPLKDISAIGKLGNLTELIISGVGGEFRVRDIIGASKLQALNIGNNGVIDLEGIENFPDLETIILYYTIPINYESLTKLQKLKTLTFNVPEQNTNLQFLANIPTLETLSLFANDLRDDFYDATAYFYIDVGFLRELRNLRIIGFTGFHIKNFNMLSELPKLGFIGVQEATIDNGDYSLFRDDVNILDYYD